MVLTSSRIEDPVAGSGSDPCDLDDTPLGHELALLTRRLLGPGAAADRARAAGLAAPFRDRPTAIGRAIEACRAVSTELVADLAGVIAPAPDTSLRESVNAELDRANAALAAHQRELLALADLLRLSHGQIAGLGQLGPAEVPLELAAARLALFTQLRGPLDASGGLCEAPERALGLLARRQDGEAMTDADRDWLFAHLGGCRSCEARHGAMLEAGLRYRIWGRP